MAVQNIYRKHEGIKNVYHSVTYIQEYFKLDVTY